MLEDLLEWLRDRGGSEPTLDRLCEVLPLFAQGSASLPAEDRERRDATEGRFVAWAAKRGLVPEREADAKPVGCGHAWSEVWTHGAPVEG